MILPAGLILPPAGLVIPPCLPPLPPTSPPLPPFPPMKPPCPPRPLCLRPPWLLLGLPPPYLWSHSLLGSIPWPPFLPLHLPWMGLVSIHGLELMSSSSSLSMAKSSASPQFIPDFLILPPNSLRASRADAAHPDRPMALCIAQCAKQGLNKETFCTKTNLV